MLRFLTQKLRTQSLNEVDHRQQHPQQHKQLKPQRHHNGQEEEALDDCDHDHDHDESEDDDRDSGTESDDENTEFDGDDASAAVTGTDCGQRRDDRELRRSARLVATKSVGGGGAATEARRRRNERDDDDEREQEDDERGDVRSMSTKKKKLAPSPVLAPLLDADSALPSDSDHFDHHSSEEELDDSSTVSTERLRSSVTTRAAGGSRRWIRDGGTRRLGSRPHRCASPPSPLISVRRRQQHQVLRARSKSSNCLQTGARAASASARQNNNATESSVTCHLPEKRKWSQANCRSLRNVTAADSSAGSSSDDEVRDLMRSLDTPVEFRTSPPAELVAAAAAASSSSSSSSAVKVSSSVTAADDHRGLRAPPTKLFHFSSSNFTPFEVCSVSPRKRHRQMLVTSSQSSPSSAGHGGRIVDVAHDRVQRPCLDFEKMQQMRNRSVANCRRTNREPSLMS